MRPASRRMAYLEYDGVKIRRQPPIRLEWCTTPDAKRVGAPCGRATPWGCEGQFEACPHCLFTYCPLHLEAHRDRLAVPPNAWKTVFQWLCAQADAIANEEGKKGSLWVPPSTPQRITAFEVAGVPVDPSPPIRIDYCQVPITKNVDLPCGHPAATCTSGSKPCPGCLFTYCAYHHERHRRYMVLPHHVWESVVRQFRAGMLRVAQARGRGLVKVRSPPLRRGEPTRRKAIKEVQA